MDKINLDYKNLGNIEFHKIKLEIADHAIATLWGQGYSVNILKRQGNEWVDNQELGKKWLEIERDNNFLSFLQKNEFNLSYYGQSIITIDRLKTGKIRLGLANPAFFNEVGKVNLIDNISAKIYRKIKKDTFNFIVMEHWTSKFVKRNLFYAGDLNNSINIQEFNDNIPEEYKLKEYEEHNLGVLPIVHMQNKQRDINNIFEYHELSDTYPVKNLIKALQIVRIQQIKEAMLNTTKVFGNFSNSLLKRMQEQNINISDTLMRDLFVQVNQGDSTSTKMVEVSQANPQLAIYDASINELLKHIWRGAGYSYDQQGIVSTSNAAALYSNSQDIRTTKLKRSLRELDIQELIKKVLLAAKIITKEDYESNIRIAFNIKENIIQSPQQILNQNLALHEGGIISKARVLQKVEQISQIQEAKSIVKEAEKEQEELFDIKPQQEIKQEYNSVENINKVKKAYEDIKEKQN